MDVGVVVLAAGLDQQHLDVLVLAQPRGQDAAGGTCADDDVIVGGRGGLGHAGSEFKKRATLAKASAVATPVLAKRCRSVGVF